MVSIKSLSLLTFAASAEALSTVRVDTSLPRVVLNGDEYTATPNGYVLSHCVYEVPHGAESVTDEVTGNVHVFHESTLLETIGKCEPKHNAKNTAFKPNANNKEAVAASGSLPADYNGWLQYTAFHNASGFDVFTSVMSVPDTPKAEPQILYLFPGLQNIDWIPKVDKEPGLLKQFDIIQPVLQYPGEAGADGNNGEWGVRSWYVTVHSGALMSELKPVKSGDSIVCNMTRTGKDSWFIGSKISSTGVETNQKATATRLEVQPWAYNTVECYGCRDCTTYPDNEFTISECEISSFDTGAADIVWESNPKPAEKLLCKESTTIKSGETVVFGFQA